MPESLTLAFTVDALTRLAEPATAFDEAKTWSTHVGFVTDVVDHQTVNDLRDRDVYGEDFFLGTKTAETLASLRAEFETDRHVFVASIPAVSRVTDKAGWEFMTIHDVADATEWEMSDTIESGSVE